jgi:hypothetical protein
MYYYYYYYLGPITCEMSSTVFCFIRPTSFVYNRTVVFTNPVEYHNLQHCDQIGSDIKTK